MAELSVILSSEEVFEITMNSIEPIYEVQVGAVVNVAEVTVIEPALLSSTLIDDSTPAYNKTFSSQKVQEVITAGLIESDPIFNASQASNITAGHISVLNNTSGTNTGDQSVDTITDVVLTTPLIGDVLKYDGTNWVNGIDSGGVPILQPEDVATITHYAPLSISGNTGARLLIRICDLSDGKQLVITCGTATSTSTECYGTVYNPTLNTWGSPTLLFTGASTSIASENAISIKTIGTDRFMLVNVNSLTELQAKVLTVSGSTITVGTAYTKVATLSAYVITNIVSAGSSYVISYQQSGTLTSALALTESVGVVTWGTVVSFTVTASAATQYLFPISATEIGVIYQLSSTTAEARCLTLSGATITASTPLTLGGATSATIPLFQKIGTEYIVISQETGQARISFLQFAAGAVTARSLAITGLFGTSYTSHSIVSVNTNKYIVALAGGSSFLATQIVYLSDDGSALTSTASLLISGSYVGYLSSTATDIAELVFTNQILRFTYSGGSLTQSVVSFSKNSASAITNSTSKGILSPATIINGMKALYYNKTTYAGFSTSNIGEFSIVDFSSFPANTLQILPRLYESENNAIGYFYANLGHYLYIIKGDLT